MNKNLEFIKNNILTKQNIFNNILVPFSNQLNIELTQFIVRDSISTLKNDVDYNYIISQTNGDINSINNTLIKLLVNKS